MKRAGRPGPGLHGSLASFYHLQGQKEGHTDSGSRRQPLQDRQSVHTAVISKYHPPCRMVSGRNSYHGPEPKTAIT